MDPLFDKTGSEMGPEMGPFRDPPFPHFIKDSLMKLGIWGPILGPFLGPFRAQFGPNSGPFLGPQKIRSGTGPARKCPPGFFSGRPAGGRPAGNNNVPTLKAEEVF